MNLKALSNKGFYSMCLRSYISIQTRARETFIFTVESRGPIVVKKETQVQKLRDVKRVSYSDFLILLTPHL